MEYGYGGLPLARRTAIGALSGVLFSPCWAAILLAPALAESTGVAEGFVGVTLIGGGVAGPSLLAVKRLGRLRKPLAVTGFGLAAIPTAALGQAVQGPLAVLALFVLGALLYAADSAVLSAVAASLDPDERLRKLMGFWLAKTGVIFAGGLLCEWVARERGQAALWWGLVGALALAAGLLAIVCPNPDGGGSTSDSRARSAQEHGSLWRLALARFGVDAQAVAFSVFVPLAVAQHDVRGVGWTQLAPPVSYVILWWLSRQTRVGAPLLSARTIALTGAMTTTAACALGLIGAPIVESAWAVLTFATTGRIVAAAGRNMHGNAAFALAGTTSKGAAACAVGESTGQLIYGLAAGWIWTNVDPVFRLELILAGGLALGVLSVIATRSWLTSQERPDAP